MEAVNHHRLIKTDGAALGRGVFPWLKRWYLLFFLRVIIQRWTKAVYDP